MPREQSIAFAGSPSGGPFLLSGFLPLVFLPLGLPERSRFAGLRERSTFRPFFGRIPFESGRKMPRCNSLAFCDQNNLPAPRRAPDRQVGAN